MPVVQPQKKQSADQEGLALQGASMIPGPVGVVAQGVNIARSLTKKGPKPEVGMVESGAREAMQRRAASLQPMNPADYGADLAAAEKAAGALPPELQQQYLPALQAARAKSQGVV